jgi:hypothetical protein
VRNNGVNPRILPATFVLAIVLTFFTLGCSTLTGPPPKPLTQQEIIELAKSGATDAQILERIRQSRTAYRLTASEIIALHNAGVSFTVIDYMLQTYIERVREDQRYLDERWWWFYHDHWYWHYDYPHFHRRR